MELPHWLIVRRRWPTDDCSVEEEELPLSLPEGVRVCPLPGAWSPGGNHVVLSGDRAVSLQLVPFVATVVPGEERASCIAWSPENTALVLSLGDDYGTNSIRLWDPVAAQYTSAMPNIAVDMLTEHEHGMFVNISASFHPDGGVVYVAAQYHGALIEWQYRTGEYRSLGDATCIGISPRNSLFYPRSGGRSIVWQSGLDVCSTSLGMPVSRTPSESLSPSWHSSAKGDISCSLVQRGPALLFAFHSGPDVLEVPVPINPDTAWMSEAFWVSSARAFVVPMLGAVARIAFKSF